MHRMQGGLRERVQAERRILAAEVLGNRSQAGTSRDDQTVGNIVIPIIIGVCGHLSSDVFSATFGTAREAAHRV